MVKIKHPEGKILELHAPDLLVEEIIFLDGLTRAGKFLLGKLASNIDGVEYFQSQILLEQLPMFNTLNLMGKKSLLAYFRLNLNNFVYERFIGRSLNSRHESSGIKNATDFHEYLNRETLPDGYAAVEKAMKKKRLPSFLVHEILPHVDFLKSAVPNFKMINIQRHPLDIIYSWFQRGWGERWGKDSLVFTTSFNFDGFAVPWFAVGWKDRWIALENNPIDRVIMSILTLQNLEDIGYESFVEKDRILRISYENLFSAPQKTIDDIAIFIGRSPYSNMNEILQREGCPDPQLYNARQKRINKVREIANPELYKLAVEASRDYDEKWHLARCDY